MRAWVISVTAALILVLVGYFYFQHGNSLATQNKQIVANEYGFSIKFPPLIANYSVEKSGIEGIVVAHPPHSIPGQMYAIRVTYTDGGADVIGNIAAIPVSLWSPNLCGDFAPCDEGEVVARTSQYVYQEWSNPAVDPYIGAPCTKEPYCSVLTFFNNLPHNNGFKAVLK
jgi:hypothetical protein